MPGTGEPGRRPRPPPSSSSSGLRVPCPAILSRRGGALHWATPSLNSLARSTPEAAMKSYKTHNDVPSNAKTVAIQLLNARLADTIDLALLTKQAHWNIKGPQFIALHEMIDGFRTEIDGYVDTIAERVVQLGGTALGTTQLVAKATTLAPYPTDIYTSKEHLAALIERYGKVA